MLIVRVQPVCYQMAHSSDLDLRNPHSFHFVSDSGGSYQGYMTRLHNTCAMMWRIVPCIILVVVLLVDPRLGVINKGALRHAYSRFFFRYFRCMILRTY